MRKLYIAVLSLFCCLAMSTTVSADILAGPEDWLEPEGGRLYILIGILVLVAGAILFKLLRNRKK